jgi:hypothetical protein
MSDPAPEDEDARRQHLLELANTAFDALRSDPDAWREYLEERAEWESTLADGLDDE